MRICIYCDQNKELSDFYILKSGKYSGGCRKCKNIQFKKYTLLNRQKLSRYNKKRIHDTKRKLVEYKGGVCQKCNGIFPPAVYDFHHIDPSNKDFNISTRIHVNLTILKQETDKCLLLCANCHRTLHAELENLKDIND